MVDARTTAKTTLPEPTRAIFRQRLIQRVSAAKNARVILITGQAAQGKTTLAAGLARQPGPTCAWLHLDASDRDPMNLFRLMAHALATSRAEPDVSAFLKNPAISFGSKTGTGRIAEMAAALLEEITAREPVRVVMDGIDTLGGNAESLAVLERIVDAVTSPGCLILVSRERPPLKLESLRIRRELLELTNDDLAFSAQEIRHFFLELYGLRLEDSQLTRLSQLTDGWAGGLVLVWEALRHVPEDQRGAFIENGLPEALRGDRLNYFSEAVFSRLNSATRKFLIRSAIFDTIDSNITVRCLQEDPGEDPAEILNGLVRQNIFIQPLYDAKTGWGYRYNQLFRDFLLDKFHHTLDSQTQRTFLVRAANLAWDDGNFEEAIRFFLKAGAFEKAAAGIKKIAMGLSAQGRFADLSGWIEILPERMIDDDSWLVFYKAMGQRISGGRKNIDAFSSAYHRFREEGERRGQLLSLAYLIEAAVFLGHPTADLKRWMKAAWSILESVSGNRYYPFAKTVLWTQLAFGSLSVAGDLQKGLSACRNALLLANTIGDDTLTVNATIIHVFGLALTGEFAAAEKELAAIERLVGAAYPEYRALKNVVHMDLALSQGDLAGAQRLLDLNQEDIDTFGLLFLYPIHVDLSGLLQIHQRRFDALAQTTRHLQDVATLAANSFYHGLALRLRALSAYHQDRFEPACKWAQKAARKIDRSLGDSVHLFRCRLIEGMAAYHLDDPAASRRALESAQKLFSRVSCSLSLVEARLGLSLVERSQGNTATANRLLESALTLAASRGYRTLPILAASDILAACSPAHGHENPELAQMARLLTETLPTERTTPSRPAGTVDTVEAVESAIHIRTLGRFEVRRDNDEVISDGQWVGNRQKLMLKAIVVNGCREVPKDILMDAIWPDSGTDAALGRFKVTLHRLRRILEPGTDGRKGHSCISLKDNRVSLDSERCRVDVNDFLAACDKVRQVKHDDDRCLFACQKAIDIYGGDFLPEEPYLNWAETKRSALRDRYLGLLMEMAAIFERKNDLEQAVHCCRRAIQTDPLAEHFHQRLMGLLRRQGRQSAAIKVYRDLIVKLAAELDTVPDPATTRIYHELVKK
jgi:LuxR family transcriptional regulator, maltose regulon positive regulatory protein